MDNDEVTTVTARKVELLLAVLLVRAGQVVSTGQLGTEIWADAPPRRATAALHVHISQLRKFLARTGRESPIVTRSPGYLLQPGTRDEIDAHDFRNLVRQGRVHARAGRHAEASAALNDALALWRGPVLGELRGGTIVDEFASWAAETRMECLEMRIESDLALGRHRELVAQLYALVAEHPLRETLQRQLMLALYRSERQADALRVYQSARAALVSDLGVEPGRALRNLHRAILQADDELELRPAA
ncbi:AfsR/SARP family transcriptional regulator [Yinghuangia sp. ASG 101]|uniref:AfsR/SARP family transcriptional regulator n=1 Tax=Yinghuangia sp. ASG 101 TaxID=2896848 RepID=UPI003FCE8738